MTIETIHSISQAKRLVDSSEAAFAEALDQALDDVIRKHMEASGKGAKIITLSGPTCSGKTTTANRLIRMITDVGYHAVVMSIDDFFLDRERTNVIGEEKPDYDSVKAIDLDAFESCVRGLMAGKPTLIPHYEFVTGKRDSYAEYRPSERDIYIFEGIQAVYPEILRCLGRDFMSIFIHVDSGVTADGVTLERHELRLLRRLVRDFRFRNANPEFTLYLWENVRQNEETNIYPNVDACDVVINSFLPYEPFFLAEHVLPLLESVPVDSPYREKAERLTEKLIPFNNPYFDEAMIPEHSVFREFIG